MKRLLPFVLVPCFIPAFAQVSAPSIVAVTASPDGQACTINLPIKLKTPDGTLHTCQNGVYGSVGNGGGGGTGTGGVQSPQTSVALPFASSTTFLQAANNGLNRIVRVGIKGDSFTIADQTIFGPGGGPVVSTNRWAEQLRIKGQATWGSHGTGIYPVVADVIGDLNSEGWACTGTTDTTNLSLGPFSGSHGSLVHMITGATCTFNDNRFIKYTGLSVYYATPAGTSSLAVVADGSTSMGTLTSANSTQAGTANAGLTPRRFDSATVLPSATHSIVYTCTGDCYLYANDGVQGTTGFSVDMEGLGGGEATTYGASTVNQLAFDTLIPGGEQSMVFMDQTNDAAAGVATATFSTQVTAIVNFEQALPSAPTVMLAIPPVDVVNGTHAMAPFTAIQAGLCSSLSLTCINIQSRGTIVGATTVGWGATYNASAGLWDLTGSAWPTGNAGVHPNDAGNLDEFQMIWAQLTNPTVGTNGVFLPLTGGTINSGANNNPLILTCTAAGGCYLAIAGTAAGVHTWGIYSTVNSASHGALFFGDFAPGVGIYGMQLDVANASSGAGNLTRTSLLVDGWGNSNNIFGSSLPDTGFSRDSAGVIDVGTGAQGSKAGSMNMTNLTASGVAKTTPTTVASLPAAATAGAGATKVVTDANSATIGACTGGGTTVMIAVSDGSAWTCH